MLNDNPWFKFALEDYRAIQNLKGKKLHRIVLFHAQQFFEKMIKGIIYKKGSSPPRTHDLVVLSKKIDLNLSNYNLNKSDLEFLTSVYIETRYPPDLGLLPEGEPSEEDEIYAVSLVEKLFGKIGREKDDYFN